MRNIDNHINRKIDNLVRDSVNKKKIKRRFVKFMDYLVVSVSPSSPVSSTTHRLTSSDSFRITIKKI